MHMFITSFYLADRPNGVSITDVILSSSTFTILWEESVSGVEYRVVLDPELSPDCVAVNTSDTSYSCTGWELGDTTTVYISAFNCLDTVSGGQVSNTTECTLNLMGKYT